MGDDGAVFVISVAARLVEMHPNTLRKYEREGFLEPARTEGNLRLYSPADITRLRQIKYLVEEHGINLAGIEMALTLSKRARGLRDDLRADEDCLAVRKQVVDQLDEILTILGADLS
ncbi:MAG TPA: MerR family transcriptional regulator [Chloroflexota bacterium]|nr:MerR family transcriptional regulator [Chloroflexota bacterium]